jgi:hypothetical protein
MCVYLSSETRGLKAFLDTKPRERLHPFLAFFLNARNSIARTIAFSGSQNPVNPICIKFSNPSAHLVVYYISNLLNMLGLLGGCQ